MTTMEKTYKLEKNLIDFYFQKSRRFLYPLLKINVKSIQPVQTFIAWSGVFTHLQFKLICVYNLSDNEAYKHFEKTVLLSHELFEDFKIIDKNRGVYVFNLVKYQHDILNFLKGKYSLFSRETKDIILKNITNSVDREYFDSFLHPYNYFDHYAKLLNVDKALLVEIAELCNPFDLEKETLRLEPLTSSIFTEPKEHANTG